MFVSSNLTLGSSANGFDNSVNNRNITVNGDVNIINARVDFGVSTWTVGGNWYSCAGIMNPQDSLIVTNGTGKTFSSDNTFTNRLGALTVNGNVTLVGSDLVLQPSTLSDALVVIGTFHAPFHSSHFSCRMPIFRVKPTGVLNGQGNISINGSASIAEFPSIFSANDLSDHISGNSMYAAGIYQVGSVEILNAWDADVYFSSNTQITGPMTIDEAAGRYISIHNATNNPNLTFGGNLLLSRSGGGPLNWIKGSGTIYFSSTVAQSRWFHWEFRRTDHLLKYVLRWTLTFISSFSAAGLTLNASALGSSATMYFSASASTFTVSTFTMVGDASHYVVLKSTASARWHLNNVNSNNVSYVYVSSSDAGAGKTIYCSNCVDGGNNLNWNFGTEATFTWTGAIDTDWNKAGNWSTGAVPRSVDDVVIPNTTNKPQLTTAVTINSLNISGNNNALDLNNFNITISSFVTLVGTMTARGAEQISVGASWTNTSGYFTAAQSTVTFTALSTGTITTGGMNAGHQFAYLQINSTTGYTTSLASSAGNSLQVNNNLTISSGTFQTGTDVVSSVTVSGLLFVNTNGTLIVGRSSTVGNGTGQTITASSITISGIMNADGQGFDVSQGPGSMALDGATTYGGTYGGVGGRSTMATYGSFVNPTSLGSSTDDGMGGGAITLSSAWALTLNGFLTANAVNGSHASGGSINIIANTLTGGGTIQANGTINCCGDKIGGGGRVSLEWR